MELLFSLMKNMQKVKDKGWEKKHITFDEWLDYTNHLTGKIVLFSLGFVCGLIALSLWKLL